jgi:hypothetical protein
VASGGGTFKGSLANLDVDRSVVAPFADGARSGGIARRSRAALLAGRRDGARAAGHDFYAAAPEGVSVCVRQARSSTAWPRRVSPRTAASKAIGTRCSAAFL